MYMYHKNINHHRGTKTQSNKSVLPLCLCVFVVKIKEETLSAANESD